MSTCPICQGTRLITGKAGDKWCANCGEPEYNFREQVK